MRTFKDNAGRAWEVSVDVNSIRRVKASTLTIDLLDVTDGKIFERLASDPITLCDVLFVICQDQARRDGVSDEDFGRALAGDAIEAATQALIEEMIAFFPSHRRALLQKLMEKNKQAVALLVSRANLEIDKITPERIADAVAPTLNG